MWAWHDDYVDNYEADDDNYESKHGYMIKKIWLW